MSLRSEWPCWEIMKCDQSQKCPAKENSSKLCWEIVQEYDSYSFNICRDCLVYVAKQENSKVSSEELLSILVQKGVQVLDGKKCPNFEIAKKE